MPANKKYLTKSPWLRLSKIVTGAVGGYSVALSFHLLLCDIFPQKEVIITSFITAYILWALLLLYAFIAKHIWKTGLLYIGLTLLFLLPTLIKFY